MPEQYDNIPGIWYRIDFHVHTPASYDYKSNIDDIERSYRDLLNYVGNVKSKLDVIVITDHNTIDGYAYIQKLEDQAFQTQEFLKGDTEKLSDETRNIIELFNSITFLPGVELDVYPGIHIIIIFDPKTPLEQIKNFIKDAGFPQENVNVADEKVRGKWNFDEACEKASEIGAIAIAAHVDGNKGIFNDLPRGLARASAFTQKNLFAMQFKSPRIRDQIISIFKNPEYERENELAFIRASDYHGQIDESLGEIKTWIRLDIKRSQFSKELIFSEIKEALRNPLERVADGPPKIMEIKRQLETEATVESLTDEDNKQLFLKYICAFANTSDRTIVIGRDVYGTWKGVKYESKFDLENEINELIEQNISPNPNIDILIYHNYEDSYFATVRVFKGDSVYAILEEDRAYILKGDKPTKATVETISGLAESNFINRYKKYSITNYLRKNIRKLEGVSDTVDILSIIRNLEVTSIKIKSLSLKIDEISLKIDDTPSEFYSTPNGYSKGNIIYVVPNKPRLEDSYLRLSAPLYNLSDIEVEDNNKLRLSGEKIIIAPQGGVYYDDNENIYIYSEVYPPIILRKSDDYEGPDFKYILAFLKSSVAIWYAERCLGSFDFRRFRILRDMIIPTPKNDEIEKKITDLVDSLLQMEKTFLDECKPILDIDDKEERIHAYSKMSHHHNIRANLTMSKIDNLFFDMLKIEENDIFMIAQRLKALGLYNF